MWAKCIAVILVATLKTANFPEPVAKVREMLYNNIHQTIGKIQWLLMAAEHRLARVGFWEAFQGSEGFPEGSLDVLLTSVGAAVIKGHVLNLCFKTHVQRCYVFVKIPN